MAASIPRLDGILVTLSQVLDGIPPAQTPPVRSGAAPAGEFCCSGGAYVVVQQLIDDVTGMPFAQAAHTLVLEPYGMRHSTFEQPLPHSLRPSAVRDDWRIYPEQAAAGLWTTPDDLARCVCALQSALAGRPIFAGQAGALAAGTWSGSGGRKSLATAPWRACRRCR